MRRFRTPLLLVLAFLLGGLLIGPLGASAAPNSTECRSSAGIAGGSTPTLTQVFKYVECREDRQDAVLAQILANQGSLGGTASPAPSTSASASPSPTPSTSPSPSASPTPTTSSSADFPTAATTGVPAGTTLTTYSGPLTITTAGTVIDGKRITGDVVIKTSGVKITRSLIVGSVSTDENSTGYSFSITDSKVDAGNRAATGVGAVNFTATRVEVVGGNRSMNCWKDCTITDSYVHGQFTDTTGRAHESGIRMGARGVIRHNTIACDAPDVPPDAGCSAALTGYGDFATVENMTVDNNLIVAGSGGFCAYGGSSAGKPYPNAHDIRFTDNTWQRGTKPGDHGVPVCGYYGPVTAFDSSAPGNVWTGNKFDDGTVVQPAN